MQIGSPYGWYVHAPQHTTESVKLRTREKYLAFVFGCLFNQENLQLVGNQSRGQSALVKPNAKFNNFCFGHLEAISPNIIPTKFSGYTVILVPQHLL